MTREEFLALMFTHMISADGELAFKVAQVAADYEREQCARLVEEMVKKNYDLDDFANSVRAGMMRLCSDGRPKWLKISMEVAAEREACARLCESSIIDQYMNLWNDACQGCADDIRARSDYDPRPPR